jgi:hypothetical protein
MVKKKRSKRKANTEEILDTVYTLIIEGVNLYKKLKPLIKRKKKTNDNDKSKNQTNRG